VIDHKAIVRQEFTRHAEAYARAAVITDEDRLARLVGAIAPPFVANAIAT
jgi:hypothetical protein